MHFEIGPLIQSVGYIGIFLIVFAESGLLIGFFLPGDSLLFTAGIFASQGLFNVWLLCGLTFLAAVLGDNVGYAFGKRIGPRIFSKKDSLFFHQKYIDKSQAFFEKHGGKTLILARFTPIVRTFAPILAGVGKMEYRRFFAYNIIGAVFWAIGLTLLGYFLGSIIPDPEKYIIPGIIAIVAISVLPSLWHIIRDRKSAAKTQTDAATKTDIQEETRELKEALKK